MTKIFKYTLLLLLGGMMMTLAAACKHNTIPENRTQKTYQLEQEFQPFYDFLGEKKKAHSKFNFLSSITIYNNRNSDDDYGTDYYFDVENDWTKGTYMIERGKNREQTQNYPFKLSDQGEASFEGDRPESYDPAIFQMVIPPATFKKLEITDYLAKHPETTLKDIIYKIDSHNAIFEPFRQVYHISKIKDPYLKVTMTGKDEFSLELDFEGDGKYYMFSEDAYVRRK